MLRKIVGVMEVDDARLVRLHHILRQQQTLGQVLGHLARHIVALDGVDGGVLVGIFLLDLFVVRLDQGEDLIVSGVGLPHQRAGIAVGDVLFGDLIRAVRHDLVLDKVLNFFHAQRAVHRLARQLHTLGDAANLHRRQPVLFLHNVVRLGDGGDDLHQIKRRLRAVSLDDLHG